MKSDSRDWRRFNVAVTGMNAGPESPGPGLAVARCIREHAEFEGRIIALGYDVLDAGLYARNTCESGYLVPYPSSGKDVLMERLREIHAAERIDVIIPCLDAEIQNFILLKDELAEMGVRMLIPSREQFALRSKDQLGRLCESIDVMTPESKIISNSAFFDQCESQGWQYPLVVKGVFYDAVVAQNAVEARAALARIVGTWGFPALVQKLIPGDEFDLSAIGDGRGRMLGSVMMRKRALTDKGKAWAGVTVSEPAIAALAEKLMSALRWSGPFELEVMRTQAGEIYVIEINPRFPAWIYLSHGVGRNLPAALLKLIAGDEEPSFADEKTGTFFIRHAQELILELPDFESMLINGFAASAKSELLAAGEV